jgi:hypothetical protein
MEYCSICNITLEVSWITCKRYQFKPLFAGLHNFRGWQPNCESRDDHREKLLLQAATRWRLDSQRQRSEKKTKKYSFHADPQRK